MCVAASARNWHFFIIFSFISCIIFPFLFPAYVSRVPYVIAIYSNSALNPNPLSFGFWNNKGENSCPSGFLLDNRSQLARIRSTLSANQGRPCLFQTHKRMSGFVSLCSSSLTRSPSLETCLRTGKRRLRHTHMRQRVNTLWAQPA